MTESRRHAISNQSLTPTVLGDFDGQYSSGSTKRFRETVDSIPAPEDELQGRRPVAFKPLYGQLVFTLGTPLVFIAMGIALEIATDFSSRNGGFKVPQVNVFGTVSGQFLSSIIPTFCSCAQRPPADGSSTGSFSLVPFFIETTIGCFELFRGNACAEESLLLDYIQRGPFFSIFHAMRWKHRIVFLSTLTSFITYSFSPLAGSIFQIRQTPQTEGKPITNLETISLANDIGQLNAFLAAAGYVNAAALHGLGDPPFVFRNWSTAAFDFPKNSGLNDTLTVNTTAISTLTNCANPAGGSIQLVPINSTVVFNLTATSVEGCVPAVDGQPRNITFDTSAATQQYGVVGTSCPNDPEPDPNFRGIMFWYFHFRDGQVPEAKTIFCSPALKPFAVTATAHLIDGRLDSCFMSGDYNESNNVTGPPQNGRAFNGLIFNQSKDPFIEARATAISSGVSGTIFRTASEDPRGLQAIFDLPNGMMDLTNTIYTQHLSVSGKSIYFTKQNSSIPAESVSLQPRLWIDPLPGHILSTCLFVIGVLGLFIHFLNYRQRKKLILATPPGSIASITALTARSGFGELLLPYDTTLQLEKKLEGIKFRLDRRTGAIVADDVPEGVPGMGRDDAMLSLLGKHNERLSQHSTSSQAAYQTAVGYPPWVYKTPYEKLPE
ncbi:hypothetical protein AN958_01314 [Leucoagaricus sp. SymC.cos]|nr:hypothetical protein AN958_01314 [Leucoagaricus sp. SymC.cos]